jgi:hypothetical protein
MGITARPIHTMARPASGVGYGMAMCGLAPASEQASEHLRVLTVLEKARGVSGMETPRLRLAEIFGT